MKHIIARACFSLLVAAVVLGVLAGGVYRAFSSEAEASALSGPVASLQLSVIGGVTEPAGAAPVTDDTDGRYDDMNLVLDAFTPPANISPDFNLNINISIPGAPSHSLMDGNGGNSNNNNGGGNNNNSGGTTPPPVVDTPEEPDNNNSSEAPEQPDGNGNGNGNGGDVVIGPSVNSDALINTLLGRHYTGGIDIFQSSAMDIPTDLSALEKAIKKSNNTCSFIAIRLSDGASIAYNVNKSYRCASSYKAFTSLYAYKQAAAGNYDLNTKLTYTYADYYSGSGIIKSSAFGSIYTLRQVANYSIRYSDNAAFIMLQRYINRNGLIAYANALGCPSASNYENTWPQVTALDAAIWWADIYGFSQSSSYGNELYKVFLNATHPVIKTALGGVYDVAHKSGSTSYYFHDCGIVHSEDPYILVMYTHNPYNYSSDNSSYFNPIVREIDKLINP